MSDTSASAVPPASAPVRRAGRRSGRRREDVLAHACLVIGERGADATRFADVSEVSGVPISTLQYYFGNREDLLVAAFRYAAKRDLDGVRAALADLSDPWERVQKVCTFVVGFTDEVAPYAWQLWVEAWRWAQRDPEWRAEVLADNAKWRELLAQTVEDGAATGRFRADADPRRVALQALAMVDGIGLPIVLEDPAVPPAMARDLLIDVLARLLLP
ncbi:TetR/AcrR family transcriptional regulator [Yinghuangia seranimata]|uniref:TetR/AcrR family transcriptional regulator n=1 Tax=Yinghuangia seranimata TaxID=408067 RepID=UPI00248C4438|nr:TetR/AcrR family transcriptional regulator [Yinghuangia seranimata]MDI2128111.1 TetR/AcrR family transcriptional regulator [Yinghuangia seranimata]